MRKTLLLSFMLMAMAVFNTAGAQDKVTDTFVTRNGKKVVITPIKHASMRISFNEKEFEIDPVSALEPKTDYSTFPKADYILVTHDHYDHFDKEAIMQLMKEKTKVLCNSESTKVDNRSRVMSNGDIRMMGDIIVEAVPAYNTSSDKLQFHPKGRDNGYVLTLDGLRIYIAGDTEEIPEMDMIKDIDIAFLPCNLPYTMTPEQVAKVARTIKPKVLFPYHYSDTKIERVAELLKDTDIDVRIRSYK